MIVIQSLVERQDASGQATSEWVDSFTTRAAVAPVVASERFAAEQPLAEETSKFRIRWRGHGWRPSPKSNRIKYQGRAWDISGVAELGAADGWELTAFAGVT